MTNVTNLPFLYLDICSVIIKTYIMKKNMGKADKIIRLIAALVIAGLYFGSIISGGFGIVLIVVAVIFVTTSFINFCPLYTILGLNTCPIDQQK